MYVHLCVSSETAHSHGYDTAPPRDPCAQNTRWVSQKMVSVRRRLLCRVSDVRYVRLAVGASRYLCAARVRPSMQSPTQSLTVFSQPFDTGVLGAGAATCWCVSCRCCGRGQPGSDGGGGRAGFRVCRLQGLAGRGVAGVAGPSMALTPTFSCEVQYRKQPKACQRDLSLSLPLSLSVWCLVSP